MFGVYRTFLALMVVALHIGGIPKIGSYAVFGFYCLSGYLMTLIMKTSYGYTRRGLFRYAANRFLRIYPMYWISILLSAALIDYLGSDYTSAFHETMYLPSNLSETLRNILIFFPLRESPRLTPPAWALSIEIFFYIIIGLGASKTKKTSLAWFALSATYHLYININSLGWNYKYFTAPAASLPFSTGALLFHYKNSLEKIARQLAGKAYTHLPLFLLLIIILNWFIGYKLNRSEGVFFYFNIALSSTMVGILSSRNHTPLITNKLDKRLGDYSYPIYLIHYQASLIVVVILSALGIEVDRPSLTLLALSIPIIFLFSWIINITIEKPIECIRLKIRNQT